MDNGLSAFKLPVSKTPSHDSVSSTALAVTNAMLEDKNNPPAASSPKPEQEPSASTDQDTKYTIEPIHLHLVQSTRSIQKTFVFGVDPGVTKFVYDLIKYRTRCSGRLPPDTTGVIELLGDYIEDAKDCLQRLQVPDEVIHVHCDKGLEPRRLGRRAPIDPRGRHEARHS